MAYKLEISSDEKQANVILSGTHSREDSQALTAQMFNPSRLPLLKKIRIDYTGVEVIGLNIHDLENSARKGVAAAQARENLSIALITNRILAKRLSRMWQAFAREAELEIRVFDTRELADEWLETL